MPHIWNTDETARFFNVDVKTIRNWSKDEGCPKVKLGRWDGKKVFEWYLENKVYNPSDANNTELKKHRAEGEKYKTKTIKKKFELLDEICIYINDVAREWASRTAEFKVALEYLAMILPALLEGKDQAEMRVLIEDEVWKLFDRVTRIGRFCPEKVVEKLKKRK